MDHAVLVLDNSGQVEGQVLGVHLGSEAVGGSLLLASGNQEVVLVDGQVAEGDGRVGSSRDTRGSQERAANVAKVDRGCLMVGN